MVMFNHVVIMSHPYSMQLYIRVPRSDNLLAQICLPVSILFELIMRAQPDRISVGQPKEGHKAT